MNFQHIAVIGAGSWGTALALVAARAGRRVTLWARDPVYAAQMAEQRTNARYLPDMPLLDRITPTADIARLADADAVLLVAPAQSVRTISSRFAGVLRTDCPVVICAKGIEFHTYALMSEVLAETLPGQPIAALSGPTFAGEVARGLPTAVSLACPDAQLAAGLTEALATAAFRPYASTDLIGVEIAGAMKNVIAIACGIVIGRRLGENARAALITRGLAEVQRLAVAKGGSAATLMSLGGIGDLTLSCTSKQSRNFAFGVCIGEGMPVADAISRPDIVVEGVQTARAIPGLTSALDVEMPISTAVARVLHETHNIDDEMAALLSRPLRNENSRS